MLESELFGHARGAFTGAVGARPGKFETANGGTLLLDEVGEMPLALQPKLLARAAGARVRPPGIEPDGARRYPRHRDHATVRSKPRSREGRFRADLYYRLNVIPISLPPLRERAGDIRELAEYFAALYAASGTPETECIRLSRELVARLEEHAWPGNVRELGELRAAGGGFVARRRDWRRSARPWKESHGKNLAANRLHAPRSPEWKPGLSLGEMERQLFAMTLESTGGNRARAAELLGVSLRTVRNKVREFGLPPRNNYRSGMLAPDSGKTPICPATTARH